MNVAKFFFSPDSRELFACFLKTVAGQSYECHKIENCRIVNLSKFCGNRFVTFASTTTVARQSCNKIANILANKFA